MNKTRKKWTVVNEVTELLKSSREKRKWQLAFRRYVIEQQPSPQYAPYFGLDIKSYREWVEIHFTPGLGWENFGTAWQFDHIIPLSYFDFTDKADLLLCWNFINIHIQNKYAGGVTVPESLDLLSAKPYFENLYKQTNYSFCEKMISKINILQADFSKVSPGTEGFIKQHLERLEKLATLTPPEFKRLNDGMSLADILLEREILRKYG